MSGELNVGLRASGEEERRQIEQWWREWRQLSPAERERELRRVSGGEEG